MKCLLILAFYNILLYFCGKKLSKINDFVWAHEWLLRLSEIVLAESTDWKIPTHAVILFYWATNLIVVREINLASARARIKGQFIRENASRAPNTTIWSAEW